MIRRLAPIAAVVFLEGLAVASAFPVLTAYVEAIGGQVALAGVLFALVTAPKIVMNPVWGRWSDRRGRRTTLLLLTVGTLTGSILWAVAPAAGTFALLCLSASRLVTGVFSSQAAIALAAISDDLPADKRAGAFGLIGAAFGLAFTIGPAIGGIVAEMSSPAAVGWIMAGCQSLSIVTLLVAVRDGNRFPHNAPKAIAQGSSAQKCESLAHQADPDHRPGRSPAGGAATPAHRTEVSPPLERGSLWSRRPVQAALLATIAVTAAQAILIPTLEPVLDQRFGFGFAETGWLLALLGFTGVLVQGGAIRPLKRRASDRTLAIVGTALLTAGFLLLTPDHLPIMAFATGIVVLAAGAALSSPTVTAIASSGADEREQGTVHGLVQSMTSVGRACGFLLGPALFDLLGSGGLAFAIAAALSLLGGSALLFAVRPRRPSHQG